MENVSRYSTLLDLLDRLDSAKIHYELNYVTPRAIMVTVAVPGEL